jgi:acetyltransferase-like isoleucine patch superfamily enzyme
MNTSIGNGPTHISREKDAAQVAATQGRLRYYIAGQSTSLGAYLLEQALFFTLAWMPSLVGLGLRALAYKLILKSKGLPAIESNVRIAQARNVTLGANVYLDYGVYLHACPQGIHIGDNVFVMHQTELHVYNFRDLPHSGIWIGDNCFIGEFTIVRGQGGVHIGDSVLVAPGAEILAVNHLFGDVTQPVIAQGIEAKGIVIEDGAWIGGGAVVLDGVRVGRGAVIGAGAVVTRDVPPFSVAVGSPARVVKQYDSQTGAIQGTSHPT